MRPETATANRPTSTVRLTLSTNEEEVFTRVIKIDELRGVVYNSTNLWRVCVENAPFLDVYADKVVEDVQLRQELFDAIYTNKPMDIEHVAKYNDEIRAYAKMLIGLLCYCTSTGVADRLLNYSLYGTIKGMIYPYAKLIHMLRGQPGDLSKYQATVLANVIITTAYARFCTRPLTGVVEMLGLMKLDNVTTYDILNAAMQRVAGGTETRTVH
jgi:hypothetical protein